jgi:hypothetical protein
MDTGRIEALALRASLGAPHALRENLLDVRRQDGMRLLKALVERTLAHADDDAADVAMIVADTGHRARPVLELMEYASTAMRQLDGGADVVRVGAAGGHSGIVAFVTALALASPLRRRAPGAGAVHRQRDTRPPPRRARAAGGVIPHRPLGAGARQVCVRPSTWLAIVPFLASWPPMPTFSRQTSSSSVSRPWKRCAHGSRGVSSCVGRRGRADACAAGRAGTGSSIAAPRWPLALQETSAQTSTRCARAGSGARIAAMASGRKMR